MKDLWMYDGGIWTCMWMWDYYNYNDPKARGRGVGWRDNNGNLWLFGGIGVISIV
jgi:hypothetical protein